MAERFTAKRINTIVRQMRQNRAEHDKRLAVRRRFLEMSTEAYLQGNGTGANIVRPFASSQLAIQVLDGSLVKGQQQYSAIFCANTPQISCTPIVVNRDTATGKVDRKMGEQERLMNALWNAMGGPQAQKKIAMSQAWGRVGWYLVMPRNQLAGLPERRYYDHITDAEVNALKASGGLTPEPIEGPDGTQQYAESGERFVARTRDAMRARAAESMFSLNSFGPDVVYPEYDADGVKWCATVLEVPAYHFGPGSDYARSHFKRSGGEHIDSEQWGLYYDKGESRIVGGVSRGGESDAASERWTYTIFGTREEVYCLVSHSPDAEGEIIWYAEHNGGRCPFVPAPAFHTDSTRPGGEYSSPMEAAFAIAAPFTQALTLLASATAYNATARWVIIREDGALLPDPITGDPQVVTADEPLGADPTETQVVAGTPFQLTINVESLFKLAEFYELKSKGYMPSSAVVGGEGYAGSTAWGLSQAIEQGLADMKQPVDNHAEAVKEIMLLCIAWMRQSKETIYAVSLPGKREDARSVQGLIEFDPQDLVTSINVKQSASTAQSKIVTRAAGEESLKNGTLTLRDFFDFVGADDSRAEEMNIYADRLFQAAAASIQQDYVLALRGEMSAKMLALPAVALKTATDMAVNAQSQAAQQELQMAQQTQGNIAEATGLRAPGLPGMGTEMPAPTAASAPLTAVGVA